MSMRRCAGRRDETRVSNLCPRVGGAELQEPPAGQNDPDEKEYDSREVEGNGDENDVPRQRELEDNGEDSRPDVHVE